MVFTQIQRPERSACLTLTRKISKELRALVEQQLQYTLCVSLNKATHGDIFNAVALAIRHFQQDHFLLSQKRQREERKKRVYYLSMEFFTGTVAA